MKRKYNRRLHQQVSCIGISARNIDQLTNIFYKCVEPHVSQILWNDLVRELRMDGVTGLLQSVTESTASEN